MKTGEGGRDAASTKLARVSVRLPITLGQFLKVCGFASTGGEAKLLITSGAVSVNGETDTRRGRKLIPGDVVSAGTAAVVVADSPSETPPAPPRMGHSGL